jgi:NADH-quinone oxidoreductase subunit L
MNLPHWIHVDSITGKLHHLLEPVFAASSERLSFDAASTSLEFPLMGVTLLVVAAGVGGAWVMYGTPAKADAIVAKLPAPLVTGSRNKWFVDEIYELTLIGPILAVSKHVLWAIIDVQIIDGLINLLARATRGLGAIYGRIIHVGQVQAYALAIAVGTGVLVLAFGLGA